MAGFTSLASSWDCQPGKCKNLEHANYIISCITRHDLKALKNIFRRKCKNATNIVDLVGRDALHLAVSCGKYDVAEWLINQCSVDIHVKDIESGWNALHRSLYFGNIDCAVLLLKSGLDFSVQDRDGMNPLKLIICDSNRSNLLKNEKIKLGRVILPYHASEQGELSLHIDQLVDVIKEFKSTGWGFGKISGTKEKGKFPLNFIEILGDKESDFAAEELKENGYQSDAYLWGNNSNFTLGQSDTKNRESPELVETLHVQKCSIIQVAVSKYHTVFLCTDGSVFTCGQGRGGRLGHGNEQTVLSPKKIAALNGIFCTGISNANDHTLILDQMGQVYSFGLNTYHQLGHFPVPLLCQVPKAIYHKHLKGKIMIGIAAARFHSAIYTKHELFTFGLNAGQLGHAKGDSWQSIPRFVSSICKKDSSIEFVAVSDGATFCALNNGDIFVLQDYTYRRIATKMINMKKLVVTGGELTSNVLTKLQHHDPDELQVAVLKTDGMVLIWRPGYGSFKECYWAGKRRDIWHVIDISLGKHLLISTDEGTVYHGHFRASRPAMPNHHKSMPIVMDTRPASNSLPAKTTLDLLNEVKKRKEEMEEVMIERIPLLYRGYQVACDVKSKTFAVIQNDAKIGMKAVVDVSEGTMNQDLGELLEEANAMDNIHDVIIKVKSGKLAAHRFILVSKVGNEISSQLQFDAIENKYLLDLKKYDIGFVRRWLNDVYTGKTQQTIDSVNMAKCHAREETVMLNSDLVGNGDCDLVAYSLKSFSLRDIESPDDRDSRSFCDESGNLHKNLPTLNSKKSKKNKKTQKDVSSGIKSNGNGVEGKGFRFWKQMQNLSDVRIEAEDGIEFNCHRCILIARLEYFKGMLSSPWMESSWIGKSIKIPMPSRILKIIIDFAYTDEAHELEDCLNVDLLCDVILYADQWLIVRLKEICESSLIKQVSLKNALDMLNFACTYNTELLKIVCCEFVCNNLAYFLEMRILESLPPDVLMQLSKSYKQLIPNMAYRIITPCKDYIDVDELNYKEEKDMEGEERFEFEEETNVFLDEIKQGKSPRDKTESFAKKRRRRRRTASARETSFCEEFNIDLNENDLLMQALEGKEKSLKDESDATKNEEMKLEGVGYSLERETDLKQVPFSSSNDSKSVSGSGIKSLREIMKEEEGLENTAKFKSGKNIKTKGKGESDGVDVKFSIKWDTTKKKSQKKRKEEMKLNQTSPRDDEKSSTENKKAEIKVFCPWANTSITPVKSLKDVMNEETTATTNEISISSPQNKNFNGARRKLSWKEANRKPETTAPALNESAWSVKCLATSPPSSTVSLSAIMKSQIEEKETSNKILKKQLQLIQIEEKAIEELLLHYNAKDNPTEYITVKRVKDVTAIPVWNVNDRK